MSVMAKVVGVKIDGIPGRSDAQELYDFARNTDLCSCIADVVAQEQIRPIVNNHHAKKQRCFVYIVTKKEEGKYIVVSFTVLTDPNTHKQVADDARFLQYLAHYDMNYMMPVYICCIDHPEFFATIIGQPWIDQTEILKRLK